MTLGLANVRALLEALGHPERAFRSVVVAGTNGKGSVTAILSAVLECAGVRVGRYTSPHIYHVTERICLNNEPVSIDVMEEAASRIVPHYDEIGFSYFEALTAIAFLVFAQSDVEVAVLETGLGGRFDATNVTEPEVCVITSIALDHRRILGDSEEEILREKLGITRPGKPLLVGALSPGLIAAVERRAARDGFPVVTIDDIGSADITEMTLHGSRARIRTARADYGEVPLPFAGAHQVSNTLLAIGAAERVTGTLEGLHEASARARMPGRFEVLDIGDKHIVLDVAHNDQALIATASTLAAVSEPCQNALVLGMLDRKELIDFHRALEHWFSRLHLVDPVPGESLSAPRLLERIGLENLKGRGMDVILQGALGEDAARWRRFIEGLLDATNPSRVLLVTGSHRTVEAFGRHLHAMEVA
jgi:dihydrofolate synthase/folylpolyglutamate synthase